MGPNRELKFDVCPLCGEDLDDTGLTRHLQVCENRDLETTDDRGSQDRDRAP